VRVTLPNVQRDSITACAALASAIEMMAPRGPVEKAPVDPLQHRGYCLPNLKHLAATEPLNCDSAHALGHRRFPNNSCGLGNAASN